MKYLLKGKRDVLWELLLISWFSAVNVEDQVFREETFERISENNHLDFGDLNSIEN